MIKLSATGANRRTAAQSSNLDATGHQIVKRGCIVEYPGGARGTVGRVRMGKFASNVTPGHWSMTPCNKVVVITKP